MPTIAVRSRGRHDGPSARARAVVSRLLQRSGRRNRRRRDHRDAVPAVIAAGLLRVGDRAPTDPSRAR